MLHQEPDQSLKSHIDVVKNQTKFINKLTYSLQCVLNSLNHSNSNRLANVIYVVQKIPILVATLSKSNNPQYHCLTFEILSVLSQYLKFNDSEQNQILDSVEKVAGVESNQHIEVLVSLCFKLKHQDNAQRTLLNFLAEKQLTSLQAKTILEALKKRGNTVLDLNKYLKIGQKFLKDQELSLLVLKLLYRDCFLINKSNPSVDLGIKQYIQKLIQNFSDRLHIQYYSKLLFDQNQNCSIQNKNIEVFFKVLFNSQKPIYIPKRNLTIEKQSQLINKIKQKDLFENIIHYCDKYGLEIPLDQIDSGDKSLEHLFLLRALKCKVDISPMDQKKYLKSVPIGCLTLTEALYQKLVNEPTVKNAHKILKTIGSLNTSDKDYPSLLINLQKIWLQNKQQHSLQQIEKIIVDNFDDQFLVKQIKQKKTEFFIWIPVLASGTWISKQMENLCKIFMHQTITLQEKFYVAFWFFKRKQLVPVRSFLTYLSRLINGDEFAKLMKEIDFYLNKVQINDGVKNWIALNLEKDFQKFLQNILSKLVIDKTGQTAKVVFSLEKWGVFKNQWKSIYRWVLNGLQSSGENNNITLDSMEIFEMIMQNINRHSIPSHILKRFIHLTKQNIPNYHHQHLFSLERILQILFPEGLQGSYEQQINYSAFPTSSQDLLEYIHKFACNTFFGYLTLDRSIQIIKEIINKSLSVKCQKGLFIMTQILLWQYKSSEVQLPLVLAQLSMQLLVNQSSRIRKNVLLLLSEAVHSYNLLKIPICTLLSQYIDDVDALSSINMIIQTISNSNPKSVGKFELQSHVHSILIRMIVTDDEQLLEKYIDLLDLLCFGDGIYYSALEKDIPILNRILVEQAGGFPYYRSKMVKFILQLLLDLKQEISLNVTWGLLQKYLVEENIVKILLLKLQSEKDKVQKSLTMQSKYKEIIFRVNNYHNSSDEIVSKCRAILTLNLTQKQNAPQAEFCRNFEKANYAECERILESITNPYLIVIKQSSISKFFDKSASGEWKKLGRFLFETPKTRDLVLNEHNFFNNPKYLYLLIELQDSIQNRKKNQVKNYENGRFELAISQMLKQIDKNAKNIFDIKTLQSIYSENQDKKDKILRFLSRLESLNKTITDFLQKKLTTQPNWQLSTILVPIQFSQIQQIPSNYLITHLQPHLAYYQPKNQNYISIMCNKYIKQSQSFKKSAKQLQSVLTIFLRNQIKAAGHAELTLVDTINSEIDRWHYEKSVDNNDILNSSIIAFWLHLASLNKSNKILMSTLNRHFKLLRHQYQEKAYIDIIIRYLSQNQSKIFTSEEISEAIEHMSTCQKKENLNSYAKKALELLKKSKVAQIKASVLVKKPKNQQKLEQKMEKLQQIQKSEQKIATPQQSQNIPKPEQIHKSTNQQKKTSHQSQEKQIRTISKLTKLRLPQPIKVPVEEQQSLLPEHPIQSLETNLTSIKGVNKFVNKLLKAQQISENERQQLKQSVQQISQTAQTHKYYSKKINGFEIVQKLILINSSANIMKQLVHLLWVMSQKKQYTTLNLFSETKVIEFLKYVLKEVLANNKETQQSVKVYKMIVNCKKSNNLFLSQGLLSMAIEIANKQISVKYILTMLVSIQLTPGIINEIYQRGFLKKMITTFQDKSSDDQVLIAWMMLAGKICINDSIQNKFINENVHNYLIGRCKQSQNQKVKKTFLFFLAYLCVKNQKISLWIIQQRITQMSIKWFPNGASQLYLLFYHFTFENQTAKEHAFRINYHQFLLAQLKQTDKKKEPYFYRSLGVLMGTPGKTQLFLKEHAIKLIVQSAQIQPNPDIYECLLQLIVIFQSEQEFQELNKQNFWKCLDVFQYKLKNDDAYTHVLKIFLYLMKKYRMKEISQPYVTVRVIKKADLSLNMEGKELSLKLISGLSLKLKQKILTNECIKILQVLIRYEISKRQLQLTYDMLKLEDLSKDQPYLKGFDECSITGLIADKFSSIKDQQMQLIALQIFLVLSNQHQNSKTIGNKILTNLVNILRETNSEKINQTIIQLLTNLLDCRQTQQVIKLSNLNDVLQTNLPKFIVNQQIALKYVALVKKLKAYKIITDIYINKIIEQLKKEKLPQSNSLQAAIKSLPQRQHLIDEKQKQLLTQGVNARMYKEDGSSSDLIFFITQDLMEINCVVSMGEPIKQKWRLPFEQINHVVAFKGNSQSFKNTIFQKSAGFFSNAPPQEHCMIIEGKNKNLYPCFSSKQVRDKWFNYITMLIDNYKSTMKKLSNK